jgi:hypothetical protein
VWCADLLLLQLSDMHCVCCACCTAEEHYDLDDPCGVLTCCRCRLFDMHCLCTACRCTAEERFELDGPCGVLICCHDSYLTCTDCALCVLPVLPVIVPQRSASSLTARVEC